MSSSASGQLALAPRHKLGSVVPSPKERIPPMNRRLMRPFSTQGRLLVRRSEACASVRECPPSGRDRLRPEVGEESLSLLLGEPARPVLPRGRVLVERPTVRAANEDHPALLAIRNLRHVSEEAVLVIR